MRKLWPRKKATYTARKQCWMCLHILPLKLRPKPQTGKMKKYKEETIVVGMDSGGNKCGYNNFRCRLLPQRIRAAKAELRVAILEGWRKGETHTYFAANVRLATPQEAAFFQPPEGLGQSHAANTVGLDAVDLWGNDGF